MTYISGCEDGGNLDFANQLDSTITFTRYPALSLFVQQAPVPSISAVYPNVQGPRLNIGQAPISASWPNLEVTFLVLKNLSNYLTVHEWLVNSINQKREDIVSDAMQIFMTGDKTPIIGAHYYDAFPVALTGLPHATDEGGVKYIKATVSFRYKYYEFKKL